MARSILAIAISALMLPVQAPSMALDHVVLAVNDLDAMAARYRAMGFALKPGRPHANGIRNEHVKFIDGTELELLTAPGARDALTRRYRRHLADGDGPAFLALFPRPSPPTTGAPDYIFFGQGNRSPTDRPEHFAHRNTADRLIAVWLAGSDFSAERALLARYGVTLRRGRLDAVNAGGEIAALDGGALYLLPASFRQHPNRPVIGVTFRVRNLDAAERILRDAGIQATHRASASLLVALGVTGGIWIEFRRQGS